MTNHPNRSKKTITLRRAEEIARDALNWGRRADGKYDDLSVIDRIALLVEEDGYKPFYGSIDGMDFNVRGLAKHIRWYVGLQRN
jgi:hypothetical protein